MWSYQMEEQQKSRILIYDAGCPKCRFISKVVKIFDLRQKFAYYSIREKKGVKLLHEFFRVIPV